MIRKITVKRILCALLLLAVTSAHADLLNSGQRALNAGNYKQALNDLNKYLDRNPNNAEARFSKGLTLVMLKQDDGAIQVFSDLVRDFPELPEPYNNLAVLYARAGRYDEARDALESALVTHPSYATAHENLGDIYAALANAAYNRAIVLDKNNQAVRGKQELVAQLVDLEGSSTPPVKVATVKPRPASSSEPSTRAEERVPAPRVPVTAAQSAPAVPIAAARSPARSTPTATAQPIAPVAAPKPITPAQAPSIYDIPDTFSTEPVLSGGNSSQKATQSLDREDEKGVLARLESWRAAWSNQDPDAYLANYSPNFKPTSGLDRSAWEAQRRTRVVRPRSILIQVLQPKAYADSNGQIRVEFTQIYESNSYSDQVRKRMVMEKVGGSWMILKESVIG